MNRRHEEAEENAEEQYHVTQGKKLSVVHSKGEREKAHKDDELDQTVDGDHIGRLPVADLDKGNRDGQTGQENKRRDDRRLLKLEDVPPVKLLQFLALKAAVAEEPSEGNLPV